MKLLQHKLFIILILLLSGGAGLWLSLLHYQSKPDDSVTVIQTFHYPALFAEQLKNDKNAGEKIFNQFCTSCHGVPPIIDVNAPKIGDKKAWEFRKKMGVDVLFKITTTGIGAMPARGGCFECTDQELKEAVQYILIHS